MPRGVLIFGLSHVGLRIAEFLHDTGVGVTAVADSRKRGMVLQNMGVKVIFSDSCDLAALKTIDLTAYGSIVLSADNELYNLQTALYTREINPHIKIVARLFNLNLGRKLQDSINNIKVLSVSQTASSSFATSALIVKPVRSFKVNDGIMMVYKIKGIAFEGKTVLDIETAQDIKVIAVNDDVFPDENTAINAVSDLIVWSSYTTAKELSGVETSEVQHNVKMRRKKLLNLRHIDTVLLYTVMALIGIAAFSVCFFHYSQMKLSFIDSLYFVVTVLTTVGLGDINLKDSCVGTKVVGMILMLSGVTLFAILFAIISGELIKKRLELFMGRKKTRLRGHVILCGVGDVGVRVLEELLTLGEKVLAIEKNPDNKYIPILRQRNVPFIISDAALEETLRLANLRHAKSIICATDDDMKNLEIGLNAITVKKHMRVVLRIFDREFAHMIQKHFDIHVALSSAAIAAPAFGLATGAVHAHSDTEILGIFDAADHRLALAVTPADAGFVLAPNRKPLFYMNNQGDISFDTKNVNISERDKLYYMAKWGD
ncbi:MAG: NAD-binding protein [Nitrospirae bacterium]|nr:NAD-binding protein [Nitrospirota bacterium]